MARVLGINLLFFSTAEGDFCAVCCKVRAHVTTCDAAVVKAAEGAQKIAAHERHPHPRPHFHPHARLA